VIPAIRPAHINLSRTRPALSTRGLRGLPLHPGQAIGPRGPRLPCGFAPPLSCRPDQSRPFGTVSGALGRVVACLVRALQRRTFRLAFANRSHLTYPAWD
jgi:hypothetical protein